MYTYICIYIQYLIQYIHIYIYMYIYIYIYNKDAVFLLQFSTCISTRVLKNINTEKIKQRRCLS